MLTAGQVSKLIDIGEELKRNPKGHPSESYRESFASYTQEDIDGTVQALRRIYATDDGAKAWEVIHAYRTRCCAAVVGLHKDGKI